MENQYSNMISKITMAIENGKYAEATSLCDLLIKGNNASNEVYRLKGIALYFSNKSKEAINPFQSAAEILEKKLYGGTFDDGAKVKEKKKIEFALSELYFYIGNCLFNLELYAQTIQYYNKALKIDCKDDIKKKMYSVLAQLNQMSGDNRSALKNLEEVDKLPGYSEENITALLNRINIYVNDGAYDDAELCAKELQLVLPGEFSSSNLLFQILIQQHKYLEAQNLMMESAEQYRGDISVIVQIMFNFAFMECEKASYTKEDSHYLNAIKYLNQISSLNLEDIDILSEKEMLESEIYLKLTRYDDAIKRLKHLSNLTAENNEHLSELIYRAKYYLTDCYIELKDYDNALKFAVLLKECPINSFKYRGLYNEVFCNYELNKLKHLSNADNVEKYKRLISYYRDQSSKNVNDYEAVMYRCKCYIDINEVDKAMELSSILPDEVQKMIDSYAEQRKRGE